jgi:hypothetical protein
MLILTLLTVWVIEVISETVILTLSLGLIWSVKGYYSDFWSPRYSTELLAIGSFMVAGMFSSGFLLTTAILRVVWRSQRLWDFSTAMAILSIAHLQILLMMMREPNRGPDTLTGLKIQAASAVIVFACTFTGGWFIRKYLFVKIRS